MPSLLSSNAIYHYARTIHATVPVNLSPTAIVILPAIENYIQQYYCLHLWGCPTSFPELLQIHIWILLLYRTISARRPGVQNASTGSMCFNRECTSEVESIPSWFLPSKELKCDYKLLTPAKCLILNTRSRAYQVRSRFIVLTPSVQAFSCFPCTFLHCK